MTAAPPARNWKRSLRLPAQPEAEERVIFLTEFLSRIIRTTRQDIATRRLEWPLEELRESVLSSAPSARSLVAAVRSPGMVVIAEIKRASPSKGDIRPQLDVTEVARAYEEARAGALSVLTEERHFRGSLEDLRQARAASSLPVLRKDFIIDSYQVWEAAAAGADAILLIVAALTPQSLRQLSGEASLAGLECLVEVHDRRELDLALTAGVPIIGINNRNLKTFAVNLETTLNLIEFVPKEVAIVSESGVNSRADVVKLNDEGVAAVLVGEALMSSDDPGGRLHDLLGR